MNSLPTGAFSSQQMPKEKIPSGYKTFSLDQFTPEQKQLFQQMFGHLGPESQLGKLAAGDQGAFEEMERPALKQFGELQGGLASRFSGMGMGGRKSSGFQNTMTAAGQDFASQLQANRQNLQRQALSDLMGFSNQMLGQRPQERGLTEKPKSFLQELGLGLSGGIGQGIGNMFSSLF